MVRPALTAWLPMILLTSTAGAAVGQQPIFAAPAMPHWILQPPAPAPLTANAPTTMQGEPYGHVPTSPWVMTAPEAGAMASDPRLVSPSLAHLHHPAPGVANDPTARGPGTIGAGEHWLRPQTPTRATIPGAATQPVWKNPYSYGYFGAPEKRHWIRQHGYRDRTLQWTLR